jgi:SAM-dependent methyltransferase
VSPNIYDDPDFQAAYRTLDRSEHGLEGAVEWPAVRALLPAATGREVLDLGCGYGAFARWAVAQGATRVDALDLSETMLDRARELTDAGAAIDYRRADLETVELAVGAYDLAYSALVLHYVVDLARLIGQVHAALRPGGSLVFTAEHPVYTAPTELRWLEVEGRRVWPLDRYGDEGERVRDWLAPGVRKQHRTLGTYVNTLVDAGFVVRRVVEWRPTEADLAADPDLAEEVDRPMFLLVVADRE